MKNILYCKCFKKMGTNDNHLKLSNMVLEDKIVVQGTVKINVTLGSDGCIREEEIKFYVVDIDFPYNATMGTPAHAAFELIISMSHQQVRFTTKNRVDFVKSSPKSLLGYMMKSQKQQDQGLESMEIGSIMAAKEDGTERILTKQIFDFVIETSKSEKYEEVNIHLDYPSQKV